MVPNGTGSVSIGNIISGADLRRPLEVFNSEDPTFRVSRIDNNTGAVKDIFELYTHNNSVSEYLNFPFNSYTRFNGKNIVANRNGIFELDDTPKDDFVFDIKANVKTDRNDIFGDSIQRLRDSFLTYRSDGDVQVVSGADKKATRRYLVEKQINGINKNIKKRRLKFERGIKNRIFDFDIKNINGSELEIESFIVYTEPVVNKRR